MEKEFKIRFISSLIIIPTAFFFIIKGSIFFTLFLSIFFLVTTYEWLKMTKFYFIKFCGISYLIFAFYSAYLLRDIYGEYLFLFIIVICIFTDTGGYIFGKIFRGPKLIKISPNKTYSGVVGSFILSTIAGLIYLKYIFFSGFNIVEKSFALTESIQFSNSIIMILFISAISQIGDLIVSYFKRIADIKDTGNIIPGHGGFLDRVDGIIFAVPVSNILFYFLI